MPFVACLKRRRTHISSLFASCVCIGSTLSFAAYFLKEMLTYYLLLFVLVETPNESSGPLNLRDNADILERALNGLLFVVLSAVAIRFVSQVLSMS